MARQRVWTGCSCTGEDLASGQLGSARPAPAGNDDHTRSSAPGLTDEPASLRRRNLWSYG
jgi:hypothetical protein